MGPSPPATIAGLFVAAVAQHQSGAIAEAERRYRHILTLFPAHADSLHNLGLIAFHGGNAASAVDLIGKAIRIDDQVPEYHYNIALAFHTLRLIDQAAAHLERAIEIRGAYPAAHLNLGNVRREQGRLADAVTCYERALALNPNSAATHVNLGNALVEQGRHDAAIKHYRQTLLLEPNNAEAHAGLGGALMATDRVDEAVFHFESAAALRPDLPETFENLAKAQIRLGKPNEAIHAAARALELEETPQRREFLGHCMKRIRFTADDGDRFRNLLLRAFIESWSRPRTLIGACISVIKLNGTIKDGIMRADAVWPARLPMADLFGGSTAVALSRDELLLLLLECGPITDLGLERLLTNFRQAMLTAAAAGATPDERLLGLCCAVARQCFINEYIFSVTEVEAEQARHLRTALQQSLIKGEPCPPLWLAAVGSYFPLHALANVETLPGRSWPRCVGLLIAQQIEVPARERRIAATLPMITAIEGTVSRAVRQQYEESPYPRWAKPGPPQQPRIISQRLSKETSDVLIAGCGTGLSTVEFALSARQARILAIDLSIASLSYAKRAAQDFGLTNVEFAQADILNLGSVGREFDFIDSSGVLHHLADPWEGWRVLLSLLRPGGIIQVGLYSEIARRNIVAARALTAERGYQPTPQDIRRCREDIMASEEPLLKSVIQWDDFFTSSECRDLLFHVQEIRVTLPEIKAFLAANGVNFAGFNLDPTVLQLFSARFPDRTALTDLDCWHAFETEAPNTFAGMYQFWVQKPPLPQGVGISISTEH